MAYIHNNDKGVEIRVLDQSEELSVPPKITPTRIIVGFEGFAIGYVEGEDAEEKMKILRSKHKEFEKNAEDRKQRSKEAERRNEIKNHNKAVKTVRTLISV